MPHQPYRIGLLGHGVVGSAFEALLDERKADIESATGRSPEIGGILTRSRGNFQEILERSDVIVEVMGGIEPAGTYALETLRAGKPLITANKQLLAARGSELLGLARKCEMPLRFEASVAGAVPIIRTLDGALGAAEISRVYGIVNGTTNFILSAMEDGKEYGEALVEAREAGYYGADGPTEDVSGKDAAAKMAILARLAFGVDATLDDVYADGIEELHPDDLQYARDFDMTLKLLGSATRENGRLALSVHPTFLPRTHPLAAITGPINAVTVEGEAFESITLSAPGAGGPPTASAVLGDLLAVMRGESYSLSKQATLPIVHDTTHAFYLHVEVADDPGTLSRIAGVLGDEGISIQSVLQRGLGETARLIFILHPTTRPHLQAALTTVGHLDVLRSSPRVIHVLG